MLKKCILYILCNIVKKVLSISDKWLIFSLQWNYNCSMLQSFIYELALK